MKHEFIIEIETDEATEDELLEAIKAAVGMLELPNGDYLYADPIMTVVSKK